MRINVTTEIKDLEGQPFLKDKEAGTCHTVRTVAVQALLSPSPDQQKLDGEESFKRGKLAERIFNAEQYIDLTAEEIAEVKKLAGKVFLPAVILPFYTALENPKPEAVAEA